MTDDGDGKREPGAAEGEPEDGYTPRSRFIHGKMVSPHWDYSHHIVPPISASAAYRLDSSSRGTLGFSQFASGEETDQEILIYDRLHEPTGEMLEYRLATAAGGECAVSFSTGMAAISAALGILTKAGDHVLAHRCLYGCTASLLRNWYPRMGVEVDFVDAGLAGDIRAAIRPNTRAIYVETPTNPTLDIIDLAMVAAVATEANAGRSSEECVHTICDNTFATPVCQRPMEHGIDIVVHSLTKGIGGFGTDMGGMVVAPREFRQMLLLYRKDFGGSLSPKAAWPPLIYGLPTLPLRMKQQQDSATRIARFLHDHPLTEKVSYPGLPECPGHELARRQMVGYDGSFMPGSMIYFTLKDEPGSNQLAEAFIDYAADNSYCITLAVSLGQIKTLIENPCSMTHSTIALEEQAEAGIEPGGIRLSLGIEDTDDLIADLSACFEQVASLAQV